MELLRKMGITEAEGIRYSVPLLYKALKILHKRLEAYQKTIQDLRFDIERNVTYDRS
jgi:hypothetical protein